MRNFGAAERMTKMMERFGMEDGEALEHSWLNRSVETAQKRVEQRNYMWRKRVLDFDDVMNQQREVVYGYRNEILSTEDPREELISVIEKTVPLKVAEYFIDADDEKEPDYSGLLFWLKSHFPLDLTADPAQFAGRSQDELTEDLVTKIKAAYELKISHEDPTTVDHLERSIALSAIDQLWQEHLYNMDALREGVSLRAQGQKDPLIEYKKDAYAMFAELMDNISVEILHGLFRSATSAAAFENFLRSLPRQQSGGGNTTSEARKQGPPKKVKLAKRRPTVNIRKKSSGPLDSSIADEFGDQDLDK